MRAAVVAIVSTLAAVTLPAQEPAAQPSSMSFEAAAIKINLDGGFVQCHAKNFDELHKLVLKARAEK